MILFPMSSPVPCDYIPKWSYPLFMAREFLAEILEPLKRESTE